MWKQFIDYATKVATLTQRVQKQEDATKELRQEIKELNQKFIELYEIVRQLAYDFERERDKAESEREMQRLRLENIVLRSDRLLLPGPSQPEHENNTLQGQLETLQRENEQLRKRLEQQD